MAEIKVPVGKDETHIVYAHASFWTHELTVTVDDKPHSSNKGFWKWDKSTTVSVGDKEKHKIDVSMDSFIPELRVWVDGVLVATS
jgi:hypothetical protein